MKSYFDAVEKVAKEYSHRLHDSLVAWPNSDMIEMISFIFDVPHEEVSNDVEKNERKNRSEWWK